MFVTAGAKATLNGRRSLGTNSRRVLGCFWKLGDMEMSDDYENRFGARHVTFHGLVVVGRDQLPQPREKTRLSWRQDHIKVHSKKASVVTFDQLFGNFATGFPATLKLPKQNRPRLN
jgi:hypothetical protein